MPSVTITKRKYNPKTGQVTSNPTVAKAVGATANFDEALKDKGRGYKIPGVEQKGTTKEQYLEYKGKKLGETSEIVQQSKDFEKQQIEKKKLATELGQKEKGDLLTPEMIQEQKDISTQLDEAERQALIDQQRIQAEQQQAQTYTNPLTGQQVENFVPPSERPYALATTLAAAALPFAPLISAPSIAADTTAAAGIGKGFAGLGKVALAFLVGRAQSGVQSVVTDAKGAANAYVSRASTLVGEVETGKASYLDALKEMNNIDAQLNEAEKNAYIASKYSLKYRLSGGLDLEADMVNARENLRISREALRLSAAKALANPRPQL